MSTDYIKTLPLTKRLLDNYQSTHSTEFPGGSTIHYDQVLCHTHTHLNEHVHPKIQARGELHDNGVYLTDHGPKHIELVMGRASQLVRTEKSLRSDGTKEKFYETCLSPYEIFILAVGIHFHDIGNMYGREGHEQRIREEMQKVGALTIPLHEKTLISQIAACHSGTIDGSKDTIQFLKPETQSDGHATYRPQVVAAVLRLADELADEHSRADNYGLLRPDQLPETCLLFHKYAEGLRVSIAPLAGYISLQFSLYEEDLKTPYKKKKKDAALFEQFLLDEIYERTLKTYVEMQYCGRYMRALESHLHEVRVEILIYPHKFTSTASGQLHYIIGDTDYPNYAGAEKSTLLRLARNFSAIPDGSQIASRLTAGQPLPIV